MAVTCGHGHERCQTPRNPSWLVAGSLLVLLLSLVLCRRHLCLSAGTDVPRWQEQKASVCRTGVLQWWQHSGFGSQLPSDCTEGAPRSTPFGLMLSPHISLLQFHFLHEKCCGGGHFRAVMGMQTYEEVVLPHIIHKKNCIFPDLSVSSVCAEHKEASESMTFCIIETLTIPVAHV